MIIPDELPMHATLFGDMKDGGYMQCYRNEEYGIDCIVTAETRRSKPTRSFAIDRLPDQVFDSIDDLRAAVADIDTDEKGHES